LLETHIKLAFIYLNFLTTAHYSVDATVKPEEDVELPDEDDDEEDDDEEDDDDDDDE
jgi:hypothetical protein